jgi:hypothetical protein
LHNNVNEACGTSGFKHTKYANTWHGKVWANVNYANDSSSATTNGKHIPTTSNDNATNYPISNRN